MIKAHTLIHTYTQQSITVLLFLFFVVNWSNISFFLKKKYKFNNYSDLADISLTSILYLISNYIFFCFSQIVCALDHTFFYKFTMFILFFSFPIVSIYGLFNKQKNKKKTNLDTVLLFSISIIQFLTMCKVICLN